jgi:hypothetical protein
MHAHICTRGVVFGLICSDFVLVVGGWGRVIPIVSRNWNAVKDEGECGWDGVRGPKHFCVCFTF